MKVTTHSAVCLAEATMAYAKLHTQTRSLAAYSCMHGAYLKKTVFSPEFTGRRAQIISHDHTHHLECSDC